MNVVNKSEGFHITLCVHFKLVVSHKSLWPAPLALQWVETASHFVTQRPNQMLIWSKWVIDVFLHFADHAKNVPTVLMGFCLIGLDGDH